MDSRDRLTTLVDIVLWRGAGPLGEVADPIPLEEWLQASKGLPGFVRRTSSALSIRSQGDPPEDLPSRLGMKDEAVELDSIARSAEAIEDPPSDELLVRAFAHYVEFDAFLIRLRSLGRPPDRPDEIPQCGAT